MSRDRKRTPLLEPLEGKQLLSGAHPHALTSHVVHAKPSPGLVLDTTFNVSGDALSASSMISLDSGYESPSVPATVRSLGPVQAKFVTTFAYYNALPQTVIDLTNDAGKVYVHEVQNSGRPTANKSKLMEVTGRFTVSGSGAYASASGSGTITVAMIPSGMRVTLHTTKAS
jgi:hypothetical protein